MITCIACWDLHVPGIECKSPDLQHPNESNFRMRILANVLLICLSLPFLGNGAKAGAQQITVATAGGSVIRVQPSSDSFLFAVMQPDGTTKPRQFRYDEIRELLLTDNPIANLQQEVIALAEQLGGDDFAVHFRVQYSVGLACKLRA